jgi:VWFA-related protein
VYRGTVAIAGMAVMLLSPALGGQQAAPAADDDATAVIKVDVSVVNVLASVRDGKGRQIANLDKSDFEMREDGKPQKILYFTQETTLPLTLGLLVDSSVSQENLIGKEQDAAGRFFRQVLRPKDLAFLISFDTSVDLLQDVTGSFGILENALSVIEVHGARGSSGPLPLPNLAGGTHLYDAVFLGATDILQKEAGRKAMILITDGEDQGSKLPLDRALEAAQRTDSIIYGILFVDRAFYGDGRGYTGESILKKLAAETGGRMFRANNDRELGDAFQQISDELRSQYSIGYSPANSAHDGTYRRLDLRIRKGGLRVQARKGYYAPQDASPAPRK